MANFDEIYKAVAKHRKLAGLTQHKLAAKAGVSRELIAKLETGRLSEMGTKRLLRILHVIGLDLRLGSLNKSRPTLDDLLAEEEESGSK